MDSLLHFVVTLFITCASWLIPKLDLLKKKIVLKVLRLSAQWPKSAKFKELASEPMLKLSDIKRNLNVSDQKQLLDNIFDDIELAISGVNHEGKLIIVTIFDNDNDFLLKDLDFIVLSKMGTVILVIEFELRNPVKINSRSLFIEITSYRSYWMNASMGLSGLIFGIGMIILTYVDREFIQTMPICK
jgi:hypothetical protein